MAPQEKTCPCPVMIDLLYFLSVVEAATLVIHGLKDTIELASGPPLPTA